MKSGLTFEQWKELIPLLLGQITILVVQIIHALQARRDRKERRNGQNGGDH